MRGWLAKQNASPEALATLALVAVYVAIMSGHLHSSDGLVAYRQAESLLYNRSIHFPPFFWGIVWTTSFYGIGASLIFLPGLLITWPFHSSTPTGPLGPDHVEQTMPSVYYHYHSYAIAGAPVFILFVALTAYFIARILREMGFSQSVAMWGLGFYGLASPAIVYARGDFGQPVEGFFWAAGLWIVLRARRSRGRSLYVYAALVVMSGVLVRQYEGAILFAALFIYAWWTRKDVGIGRSLAMLAALSSGFLVGFGITLLVNRARYGSLTEAGPYTMSYFWTATPLRVGLEGSLISPARGLLWSFPAIFLIPLAMRHLWGTHWRPLVSICLGLALIQLLTTAKWAIWFGGLNWGLRLFVPALPVLAILAAIGVDALHGIARRFLPWIFFALGVLWAVPCIVTDQFGGYGQKYSTSEASFYIHGYPPIGAWTALHHWRATILTDPNAVDIYWFRVARSTHNLSLIVPVLLFAIAVLLAVKIQHAMPRSSKIAATAFNDPRTVVSIRG